MIEKIPDMPSGCLGFEAVGEVDANDYRDTLRGCPGSRGI